MEEPTKVPVFESYDEVIERFAQAGPSPGAEEAHEYWREIENEIDNELRRRIDPPRMRMTGNGDIAFVDDPGTHPAITSYVKV